MEGRNNEGTQPCSRGRITRNSIVFASDFIQDTELHIILKASKNDGLVIRWIHVIPSAYHTTELMEIQAAHCIHRKTLEQMVNLMHLTWQLVNCGNTNQSTETVEICVTKIS